VKNNKKLSYRRETARQLQSGGKREGIEGREGQEGEERREGRDERGKGEMKWSPSSFKTSLHRCIMMFVRARV